MKKLIALILTLSVMAAIPAFAASVTKYTFRAYSSATPVTCGVFGMRRLVITDPYALPLQGFTPDPDKSRTLSLGTKGFANYSTAGVQAIKFTCRNTGTNTLVPVKAAMNGVETYFLTVDSDIFIVEP